MMVLPSGVWKNGPGTNSLESNTTAAKMKMFLVSHCLGRIVRSRARRTVNMAGLYNESINNEQ